MYLFTRMLLAADYLVFFTVYNPPLSCQDVAPARASAVVEDSRSCKMPEASKKILCIEDDQHTARLIAEDLTERGFEVIIAFSGHEGLIAILKGLADLVLCDVGLPHMTGFEVLKRLNHSRPGSRAFHSCS